MALSKDFVINLEGEGPAEFNVRISCTKPSIPERSMARTSAVQPGFSSCRKNCFLNALSK